MRAWVALWVIFGACNSEPRTSAIERGVTVGDEREVEARVPGVATQRQRLREAVFDGQNYLSIWYDTRRDFGPQSAQPEDLFATRVSLTGEVLDSAGIAIWQWDDLARDEITSVAAGCDGAGTCLVLTTFVPDGSGDTTDVRGQRIRDGQVLDTPGFAIANGPGNQRAVGVAWDGSAFRVTFRDDNAPGAVSSKRVQLDGTVGAAAVISPADRAGGSLSCGPTSCLVIWIRGTDLAGQLVDANGPIGSELTISAAANDQSPAGVQWVGTQYWVLWIDDRNASSYYNEIYAGRVSATGTVLDPLGIPVTGGLRYLRDVELAHDGTDAIVTWQESPSIDEYEDLRIARLASNGSVRDPGGVQLEPPRAAYSPRTACSTGSCLVAWNRFDDATGDDVVGRRITGVTPSDPTPRTISTGPNAQVYPVVSGRDGKYTAIWLDSRGGELVRGTRFAAGLAPGTPLDVGPSRGSFNSQSEPTLAVASASTMVAWTENWSSDFDEVRARVFDANGVPVGDAFTAAGGAGFQNQPALAAGDDGFLLAWLEGYPAPALRVRAFDASGAPRADAISIATRIGRYGARVGFDGTNFLVAWEQDEAGSTAGDVYAMRISQLGAAVDPSAIAISTRVATGEELARVTCGGGACLVSWRNGRVIEGVRVAPDGSVLDPAPHLLSPQNRQVFEYGTAFDGTWFVVASAEPGGKSFLQRFAANGTPEIGGRISVHETGVQNVAVAGDGLGNAVVLYDRVDADPAVHMWRVKARELGDMLATPDGAPDGGSQPGPGDAGADAPPGPGPNPDAGSGGGCCRSSTAGDGWVALFAFGWLVARRRRRVSRGR